MKRQRLPMIDPSTGFEMRRKDDRISKFKPPRYMDRLTYDFQQEMIKFWREFLGGNLGSMWVSKDEGEARAISEERIKPILKDE